MESKIVRKNAIKFNVGHIQMSKFLFGQYVFIAKSPNQTTYSDCNTVQTTDCSKLLVNFHFHKVLNEPLSDHNAFR